MEFLSWLENSQFCTWIRGSGSIWAYPIVLTIHTLGMAILVGFNWALDLRLLGVGRQISKRSMAGFFPVMWIGFWLNLVTGLVLLAADATTKMTSWVFGVKMFFIVLAMIVLLKLRKVVFSDPPALETSADDRPTLSGHNLLERKHSGTSSATVGVLDHVYAREARREVVVSAKMLAILSLVFWTFSITAGRLMAYLGPQTGVK